jgi:UDP-N-acetylglucosamine--N-acetylmuramyl-(pentapeptide) pyrophosphoryl-undecaprenol N-acetylglucosamine transferase
MRVVLAGGGTAGHIEPALALADALRLVDGSISVTCLGTERGLETRLVPARGYDLELIPPVPLPRRVTPQLLTVPGRLASAIHKAGQVLDRVQADVLVGFGGYVATPAYLAAKRHNVAIVVHEANPRPGIANRLGAMLTTHVYTSQPDTQLRNGQCIGLPIRRQIAELDRLALGDQARGHFGLRTDMPVLLVTGGSQGARSLNRALAGATSAIRAAGVQILHVTGPKNSNDVSAPAGDVPYVAIPYVDRMDLAYAAADFALCRAGAMTCAELTAVGLPAAYVPLPIGNGEQRLNALPIVQRGGGLLVDDAELTPEWIKSTLLPVLTNIDRVVSMSEAAASLGRKNADQALAAAVIEAATLRAPEDGGVATGDPAAEMRVPPAAGGWGDSVAEPVPGESGPYQSAPVPEGGFFRPTGPRAASQRASGLRSTGQRPGSHRAPGERPGGQLPGAQPRQSPLGQQSPGPQLPSQPQPGRSPVGQPPVGQPPVGQPSVGQSPLGRPPVGQPPAGRSPLGQRSPGQPPLGPGPAGQQLGYGLGGQRPAPGRHRQAR